MQKRYCVLFKVLRMRAVDDVVVFICIYCRVSIAVCVLTRPLLHISENKAD